MHFTLKFLVVLIAAFALSIAAESMVSEIIYKGADCSGTPLTLSIVEFANCQAVACSSFTVDNVAYSSATICVNSDTKTFATEVFSGFSFLLVETFTESCELFLGATAYLASGECQIYESINTRTSHNALIATINEDGSATLGLYKDRVCSGAPFVIYTPDKETVSNHSCYGNSHVFHIGTESNNPSSSVTDIVSTTTMSKTISHTSSSGSAFNSIGSLNTNDVGTAMNDSIGKEDGSAEVSNDTSSGVNTGTIIGITAAYVLLSVTACILCFGRIERFARRLG